MVEILINSDPAIIIKAQVCNKQVVITRDESIFSFIVFRKTRADFVLDQSAHLFTFSLSANHNAGNKKLTPRRARKYCRLLGLM
jgi:hypothetical protein